MAHVSQEISPSGPALHLKGRCHIAHERVTAGTAGSRTAGPLDGVRVIYCGGWMIVGVSVLSAWWLTIADIADIISPPHQQPNPAWMRRDVDAGFSRFSLSISLSLSLSLSLVLGVQRRRSLAHRRRANMAHMRQQRPDYGHGFKLKVLTTVQVVPSALGSGIPQRYRGTSLIRKRTPPGPYRRPMPKVLRGS